MLPNEFMSLGIQLHVSYSEMSSQRPSHLFEKSPQMGSLWQCLIKQRVCVLQYMSQHNSFFSTPQGHER
jgi:hypothetical protein